MKVKDLINILKDIPSDAEIRILTDVSSPMSAEPVYKMKELTEEDVNYVKCNAYSTNTWVPILSTLNITCQPVYNRQNLRQFSLQEYAKGTLKSGGTKAGYL